MKEPVLILCDLHLGHKATRLRKIEHLREVIRGAGTVVFNGDTWQELAREFYRRSKAMLAELQALCAEERADCLFLPGNHDPGWEGPGYLELASGKIVITHGDTLLYAGSPWKREILAAGKRVEELWAAHPAAEYEIGDRIRLAREISRHLKARDFRSGTRLLPRIWDAAFPPKRALVMLESWLHHAEEGGKFCDRYFPAAEVLICGHFHFHGVWKVGRRVVINGGSFQNPDCARWVEFSGGWLREGLICETPRGCSRGPAKRVWRFP